MADDTEITLKFDVTNNYGRSSKDKHTYPDDPIINACWVINCAMVAIDKAYNPDAPRHIEMTKLHRHMLHQIKNQLTPEQYERNKDRFRILEVPPIISIEKGL